mgnify:CR=1 FL=1
MASWLLFSLQLGELASLPVIPYCQNINPFTSSLILMYLSSYCVVNLRFKSRTNSQPLESPFTSRQLWLLAGWVGGLSFQSEDDNVILYWIKEVWIRLMFIFAPSRPPPPPDMRIQTTALANQPHVVIATPGRLVDIITNCPGVCDLSSIKFLVGGVLLGSHSYGKRNVHTYDVCYFKSIEVALTVIWHPGSWWGGSSFGTWICRRVGPCVW